ncbi:MAG: DUF4065 domain-containing protein [Acetobacteraceae bacterium]|nr:DUF4065 domain-containing protein [Acetobacteraceae bacterium]
MPRPRHLGTITVRLPGEMSRLRHMILYVARRCYSAKYFGAIKLNKIIWKADFDAFAARGVPVTGREYRRQKLGPVLREMKRLHTEMLIEGAIRVERREFGEDIVEFRTVAQDEPNLSLFTTEDLSFVDEAISHYWEMTGQESSDGSHGVAWRTRANGDPMPYELSLLSDRGLGAAQEKRLTDMIARRRTQTL